MLQELDRRQGLAVDGAPTAPEVRTVAAPIAGEREWFWRLVAALMVCALAWVGWVAWQLQPRELVSERAILAAEDARRGSFTAKVEAEQNKEVGKDGERNPDEPAKARAPLVEPMRLATDLQVPVPEIAPAKAVGKPASPAASAPSPATRAAPATAVTMVAKPAAPAAASSAPAAQDRKLGLDVPQARIIASPTAPSGRVVKQNRALTPSERAEAEFRRAVALLGQGRGSEADDAFAAAVAIDSSHEAARQALVALRIEGGRVDDARRLLQEGLAFNPANVQFATVLARILAERREYAAALAAMQGAGGAATGNVDYQVLRATILQRLKRHAEAVEAYQSALSMHGLNAQAWIGLGISFEALDKRAEAAQSFRHALEAGALSEELRGFAEQRLRALR
ncbi:MAG: tetratricopeptide repeat protein [Betaproteobacteria bacterium]